MHSFFWLYLAINAPDFRLIPLDRNTYMFHAYIIFNTNQSWLNLHIPYVAVV